MSTAVPSTACQVGTILLMAREFLSSESPEWKQKGEAKKQRFIARANMINADKSTTSSECFQAAACSFRPVTLPTACCACGHGQCKPHDSSFTSFHEWIKGWSEIQSLNQRLVSLGWIPYTFRRKIPAWSCHSHRTTSDLQAAWETMSKRRTAWSIIQNTNQPSPTCSNYQPTIFASTIFSRRFAPNFFVTLRSSNSKSSRGIVPMTCAMGPSWSRTSSPVASCSTAGISAMELGAKTSKAQRQEVVDAWKFEQQNGSKKQKIGGEHVFNLKIWAGGIWGKSHCWNQQSLKLQFPACSRPATHPLTKALWLMAATRKRPSNGKVGVRNAKARACAQHPMDSLNLVSTKP